MQTITVDSCLGDGLDLGGCPVPTQNANSTERKGMQDPDRSPLLTD